MKRLLVGRLALVILCCFPFASVAQTVFLNEKFRGNVTKTTLADATCYMVPYNDKKELQIGSSSSTGTLTTPVIPELTGDVILSFWAHPAGDNTIVQLSVVGNGTLLTTEIPLTTNDWTQYFVLLRNADSSTRIKIQNKKPEGSNTAYRFLLYNIKMTSVFVMDESDNNIETKLASHSGETVDLMLIRTFKGGIWNTVCLPFQSNYAVWSHLNNIIEGLTESLNPELRLFNMVLSKNTLQFRDGRENISGGTPYLLKIDRDLVNPIFHNVVITTSTPSTVTDDNYSFVGTFGPTALKTDGTNVFLGTDNVLYKPAAGSNMLKGIRAYFEIPSGASARISMDDSDEATGIKTLKSNVDENKVYNLHGQQVSRTAKGLYIINGKKIILK